MDKINLGDGTQGSGDNGLVGGGKINANYIALVQAVLGVTIWSSATSENLDLTTLNTTDKSSIKAAINELLERTKLIDNSLTSSIFKTWSVDKLVATFIQATDLAGYLPLAGGTLTGTLNGTNASFSGNVGIGTVSPLGRLQINEYTVAEQGSQNIHGELSVFANNGDEFLFLGIKNSEYPNRGWAFNSINNEVNCDLQIKEHGASGIRMVIQSGGNVGIGTTNPTEKLEVNGNIKSSGTMLASNLSGTNTGDQDLAFEFNSTSTTGIQSIQAAISANDASGDFSVAMGRSTIASGVFCTAIGSGTIASGDFSVAMGSGTIASGVFCTAMGSGTIASGDYSTAMGTGSKAEGDYSTAIGGGTIANGVFSTSIGSGTTASGDRSTAMGRSTTASGFVSTSIGQFNVLNTGDNATLYTATNTAFSIGNGTGQAARSDAFSVKFNGKTKVGNDLDVNGNLYEHFTIEQISVSDTLSDTQRVLQYGFAGNGTLDIPDSLNNRVWEIFVTGTQLTVQPKSGSSVTFSVVHNGQSNDGVISQDHSAKLMRTTIGHYTLIKY